MLTRLAYIGSADNPEIDSAILETDQWIGRTDQFELNPILRRILITLLFQKGNLLEHDQNKAEQTIEAFQAVIDFPCADTVMGIDYVKAKAAFRKGVIEHRLGRVQQAKDSFKKCEKLVNLIQYQNLDQTTILFLNDVSILKSRLASIQHSLNLGSTLSSGVWNTVYNPAWNQLPSIENVHLNSFHSRGTLFVEPKFDELQAHYAVLRDEYLGTTKNYSVLAAELEKANGEIASLEKILKPLLLFKNSLIGRITCRMWRFLKRFQSNP